MKSLRSYNQDAMDEVYKRTGAFFAFNKEQFEEKQVQGVDYVSRGAGLICPRDKCKLFDELFDKAIKAGAQADLAENGKQAIIHRELSNHEYSITWDITDTVSALSGHGITEEEVQAETKEYMRRHEEWEAEQDRLYEEAKKREEVQA